MKEAPNNRGRLCARIGCPGMVVLPATPEISHETSWREGEGKFEKITWDEGLEIIAGKLKEQRDKYRPESWPYFPASPHYSNSCSAS